MQWKPHSDLPHLHGIPIPGSLRSRQENVKQKSKVQDQENTNFPMITELLPVEIPDQ